MAHFLSFRLLLAALCFFISMSAGIHVASLNVNGCRNSSKRTQLFGLIEQKRINIAFIQETHADGMNECEWRNEWKGVSVLSHGSNTSAGVAVLISGNNITMVSSDEFVPGRLLKVVAKIDEQEVVLINVYAPNGDREKIVFFNKLEEVVADCDSSRMVIVGGDFNCTENFVIDRNHGEPHARSATTLTRVVQAQELVDIWRTQHPVARQYTWRKINQNQVSMARIDRLYCTKSSSNQMLRSWITPVMFSDHFCISLFLGGTGGVPGKSYWHFNVKLLDDCKFLENFNFFWEAWQSEKPRYKSLRQWWELGKVHIKLFCQAYTQNSTGDLKKRVGELEREILSMESDLSLGNNAQTVDGLREKRDILGKIMEEQAKGAMVRARIIQYKDMDGPTKFFFNLERKSLGSRRMLCLRLADGKEVHDQREMLEAAFNFYSHLFTPELSGQSEAARLHRDLPVLPEEQASLLEAPLTLEELTRAVGQMSPGKTPGLDGLPAEFFKRLWSVIGPDFFEVVRESVRDHELPQSCRRAVITLLPKKGDLKDLKNWRPVALLCTDYKILSRAIANRLSKSLSYIVHKDQSYSVPGRMIFDNIFFIRDVLSLCESLNINLGVLSIDQEKAFDRVHHGYLFQTLAAFGFGPSFMDLIKVMYNKITSLVKVNNVLSNPIMILRGIRQGCPLSGMLYTLAIEPLLCMVRQRITGMVFTAVQPAHRVQVSAYADDITMFIKDQQDVDAIGDSLEVFQKASNAKVNWGKCEAFLAGRWEGVAPPLLPQPLQWGREGLKVLGVFLGSKQNMLKNWEGMLDMIKARLTKWRWILPQMSFRGRVLVINNLVASMLWHRLSCLDPPPGLLKEVQSVLLSFFWGGNHWLRPAILYLPVEEGGQGLVDVCSRVAAFRLQAAKRLLYTAELSWGPGAFFFLRKMGSLGCDWQLFRMDISRLRTEGLPGFYCSMLKAWGLLKVEGREEAVTRDSVLQECLFFNPLFPEAALQSGLSLHTFARGGVTRLIHLLDMQNRCWKTAVELARDLGVHSVRRCDKLLGGLASCLHPHVREVVEEALARGGLTGSEVLCPELWIQPSVQPTQGPFLGGRAWGVVCVREAPRKLLYQWCVKVTHAASLASLPASKWVERFAVAGELSPAWRTLYKPPLQKRSGDLQWRILHRTVSTGRFLNRVDPGISQNCGFCGQEETVEHLFLDCPRLVSLFQFLQHLLHSLGVEFGECLFIYSMTYSRTMRGKIQIVNFVLGQAKLAIWVTRKHQLRGAGPTEVLTWLRFLLRARIRLEFEYYLMMNDLPVFKDKWCIQQVLCAVVGNTLELKV